MLKAAIRSRMFWLIFAIPNTISIAYFGFLASPIYTSEARFVVYGSPSQETSSLQRILSPGDYSLGGANLIKSFITSPSAVTKVSSEISLHHAYGAQTVDPVSRFGGWIYRNKSSVRLRSYFNSMIDYSVDKDSSVSTLTASAFDPVTANQITEALMQQSLLVIDSLNNRRLEQIDHISGSTVDQIQNRLDELSQQLTKIRDGYEVFNPEDRARATEELIQDLQQQVIMTSASLGKLREQTPLSSLVTRREMDIVALQDQITALQREVSGSTNSLAESDTKFSALKVDIDITKRLLAAAREAKQDAKIESAKSSYFIEMISAPTIPDYPEGPHRLYSILAVFGLTLIFWGFLR